MNFNPGFNVENAQLLNQNQESLEANKIILGVPPTVRDVLDMLEGTVKDFSLIKTAILRTVVPEWGGPDTLPGKHVSPKSFEFLRQVPTEKLTTACRLQEHYFERINAKSAYRSRNRFHLKRLFEIVKKKGWIQEISSDDESPVFNRFNSPRGTRRIHGQDIKTTTRKRVPSYRLGTSPRHYVEVVDDAGHITRLLANPILDHQIKELQQYVNSVRKGNDTAPVEFVCQVLGFLHTERQIPLSKLTLDCLVQYIQLQYSEKDFEGHEDFKRNDRGRFIDPEKVQSKLAMAEAIAQRQAKEAAADTWSILEDYFAWRDQVLAEYGQLEGLSNTSKQSYLSYIVLCCEFMFQHETQFKRPKQKSKRRGNACAFKDIPIIEFLRSKFSEFPIDKHKIQRNIQRTRCISWPQAITVFERCRRDAIQYTINSRDKARASGYQTRRRALSGIACDIQKALILGFMLFIPTDRQQTYRRLIFGKTLKNGQFLDADCEQFEDWGNPSQPNAAKYWINLDDFKTVDTYGEFWYPVPNVQFADGTTFYELIAAWLWGFEDTKEKWPVCYSGENRRWQGYVDAHGNRGGWRSVYQPDHEHVFTMTNTRKPFYDMTFYALVRNLFVRYTQEDGEPVAVSPHSLRHMLSSYLNKLSISSDEVESFSYVLHHSREMHQGRYVYRDNMMRIEPAVARMNNILGNLMI